MEATPRLRVVPAPPPDPAPIALNSTPTYGELRDAMKDAREALRRSNALIESLYRELAEKDIHIERLEGRR